MAELTAVTVAPAGPGAAAAPFRPANLALCTVGLAMASFMQVLDTTIANVSLPTIAGNLGASLQQVTWVITSFAVSTAIALPLTGWLSRRFGEARLFMCATLAFSMMSLLCGLSQSMGMLVSARVLQGIAAGPMYPLTQSLLVSLYPREKRGYALALLSMVTVVAPISGPILGGWITDNYSWEWIFLINVPLGAISVLIVGTQLRGRPEATERLPMDYAGLALLIVGVGALQLLLDLGNDEDWFSSNLIITLAVVSSIALTAFVIWELTGKNPVVDLRLFRHRNFCVGTLAMVSAYACFFSIGLLVPLWLNRDMGYTPLWAGLTTAPIGILPVIMTPLVARYANRFDMRLLASLAFIIMGISCLMRSRFTLDVDYLHIAGIQLFMGLGTALFFMPMLQILLSDLDGREIASGSGLATFMRTLGAGFSASLTTYLWNQRTTIHHAQLTEHISIYTPGVQEQLLTLGQGDLQRGAAIVENMIDSQASQIAFNDILYVLGWVFFAMVFLLWFARPPFGADSGAGTGGR